MRTLALAQVVALALGLSGLLIYLWTAKITEAAPPIETPIQ
jgi:hypothetical protein